MSSVDNISSHENLERILPSINPTKLTWTEIIKHINISQKDISSLQLINLPTYFSFSQNFDSSEFKRLYFLSIPHGQHETTLMFSNVNLEPNKVPYTTSLPLFMSQKPANSVSMSKEEELLRERKRLRSLGISAYDKVENHFVFSVGEHLYWFEDDDNFSRKIPEEVFCDKKGCPMDPKLCPSNHNLVAYISNNDIYVSIVQTNLTWRLTFTRDDKKDWVDNSKSAGVASFITQEELERFTGYWWRPNSSLDEDGQTRYSILYEEVDEGNVNILYIVSPKSEGLTYDQYRYPRAGQKNAVSNLKLVEFSLNNIGEVTNIEEKVLTNELSHFFPSTEYLLLADWIPHGNSIYLLLSNRRQQKFTLASISYESFVSKKHPTTSTSHLVVLFEETSNAWLHTNNLIQFLPSPNENVINFIFPSENSGFMHLQHVQVDCHPANCSPIENTDTFRANINNIMKITNGNWNVDSKKIWVDNKRCLVYFIAYKDTPLETHLYVTSYVTPSNEAGTIVRLTTPNFSHNIEMDEECNYFISVYSSLKSSACQLFKIHFNQSSISASPVLTLFSSIPDQVNSKIKTEIFSYQSQSGHKMFGMLFTSRYMQPNTQYPVLLYVYAGPYVQLVNNSDKNLRNTRLQTFAELGYMVVVIDSRGSANRGLDFEGHIRLKMGTVEIADQVEGLLWLAKQKSFLDMTRVAIHGWSYGGYISLMGLLQRPDIFKVAISCAPVTSWQLYDTAYTERYMDLPTTNTIGYEQGSVLKHVDKFPQEDGRLLIVHGMKDENVHFCHTTSLVDALIKAGKPHRLQLYPNERHGIRSSEANEHCDTLIINFLLQNL